MPTIECSKSRSKILEIMMSFISIIKYLIRGDIQDCHLFFNFTVVSLANKSYAQSKSNATSAVTQYDPSLGNASSRLPLLRTRREDARKIASIRSKKKVLEVGYGHKFEDQSRAKPCAAP